MIRILSHLKETKKIILKLRADDIQNLTWYVDASFGMLNDMKSHAGSMFTLSNGGICNNSTHARSFTETK